MFVCICKQMNEATLREHANIASSCEEFMAKTVAGSQCGKCKKRLEQLYQESADNDGRIQ